MYRPYHKVRVFLFWEPPLLAPTVTVRSMIGRIKCGAKLNFINSGVLPKISEVPTWQAHRLGYHHRRFLPEVSYQICAHSGCHRGWTGSG